MPGPPWNEDHGIDGRVVAANARALLSQLRASSTARLLPDVDTARDWHGLLYAGCQVPVAGYVGHFRGDPAIPELVGYEVGLGPTWLDGLPERVGVPSAQVTQQVLRLVAGLRASLTVLDDALPAGRRLTEPRDLGAVVQIAAVAHGEWLRVHPFANGNGRTARVWANFVALRYGLPAFVQIKPRPGSVDYTRCGHASMGRPPDFQGDQHAATIGVFARLLADSLAEGD